jgi:predicted transcriptional regulator/RimJ/RimL family protein N-acetyltransferase
MTQNHLFPPQVSETLPVLLLSIRAPHADRIFKGEKHFELRKSLPKKRFARVYLYESGGRGVVGCFDAGKVIHSPLEELWRTVGGRATTKERFDAYFGGWQKGYAIEVFSPLKFSQPVLPPALKDATPTFTAPQSYLLLPHTEGLYRTLEAKRREELGKRPIRLERMAPADNESFISVVTHEISRSYDEITRDFATALLRLDSMGEEPNGIFTTRKEVFSAFDETHGLVGFTTLTFKLGGSAKTGPTILFPEYRGKGYGTSLRREVIKYAIGRGVRKLYCTCPDTEHPVIRHLLGNGLRIEAHLASHYRVHHGELVFGMLLDTKSHEYVERPRRSTHSAVVVEPESLPEESLIEVAHRLLSDSGYAIDADRAALLVRRAKRKQDQPYESKPISMVCLADGAQCVGISILIPKRGGATKGILVSATEQRGSIVNLLIESEGRQRIRGRRKLYFTHPLNDHTLIEILLQSGYRTEGVLEQPYTPGLDAVVMSKHL